MTIFYNMFNDLDHSNKSLFANLVRLINDANPASNGLFDSGMQVKRFPRINVASTEDAVIVEAMAPGIDVETLKVSAFKDRLILDGERVEPEAEVERYHRKERVAGKFMRTIELPVPIDADAVEAEYTHGILKVTLPKAAEARPRQIKIKAN
jgi:HSP20 family protein